MGVGLCDCTCFVVVCMCVCIVTCARNWLCVCVYVADYNHTLYCTQETSVPVA